jgi:hypothetical protein
MAVAVWAGREGAASICPGSDRTAAGLQNDPVPLLWKASSWDITRRLPRRRSSRTVLPRELLEQHMTNCRVAEDFGHLSQSGLGETVCLWILI